MLALSVAAGARGPVSPGRLVQEWSEGGEVYARAYASQDERWIQWPGVATFVFSRAARSVTAWPAANSSPEAIEDTFFRVLQPVVLQATGCQALHASGVVIGDRVIALCGRSGAGKSTMAYALGRDGDQWADDAVVIECGADVTAIGLPFAPRLRESARRHFRPPDIFPAARREVRRRPLGAVVVLHRQPDLRSLVHCRRLTVGEAFRTLVTHAHCFDPADRHDTRRLIEDYSAIADRVPAFALSYQPGFDHLPAVTQAVKDVLSTVDAQVVHGAH
jgi:hypothetical protein